MRVLSACELAVAGGMERGAHALWHMPTRLTECGERAHSMTAHAQADRYVLDKSAHEQSLELCDIPDSHVNAACLRATQ